MGAGSRVPRRAPVPTITANAIFNQNVQLLKLQYLSSVPCVALARASVFQAKLKADLRHDRPMPEKLCKEK